MNVTRAVVVQQTVDVLPTPQSPREDPLAGAGASSPPLRPQSPLRESEVLRGAYRALAEPQDPEEVRPTSSSSSTASRPRWLRKVVAWLEGRWGVGHKRKTS